MPAVTGSGESVLERLRSAEVITVVVAVPVLLPLLGSGVPELTVAEFDRSVVWPGSTLTTSVISGAAPSPSELARVQVTVLVPVHVQPVPAAETKLVPAGNASDTDTDAAFDGPAFDTDSV